MNVFIIFSCSLIILIRYTFAKCNLKFDYQQEDENNTVLSNYLHGRNSHKEFFKNLCRGRIVDPICTAQKTLTFALCECVNDKMAGSETGKSPKGNAKEKSVCEWKKLSTKKGASSFKYINLFPCKIEDAEFYLMQGYEAHMGQIYDVYVVAKAEGSVSTFIIRGVAKEIDFSQLKDDTSAISKIFSHGLSFIFGYNEPLPFNTSPAFSLSSFFR